MSFEANELLPNVPSKGSRYSPSYCRCSVSASQTLSQERVKRRLTVNSDEGKRQGKHSIEFMHYNNCQ